tara:strand:- start:756 stop:1016 length:261 start_codon:yes stop_codon:yes gene_type:complete
MAVGSILEICVGSIDSSNYPGQHKISVLFEKKFSAVPIVTLCLIGDNKESVAENVSTVGFDLVISDTGQSSGTNFKVDFQAFNVIG